MMDAYLKMNKIRLLCLVMAICFASGAKAQFYDSADDIYYYEEFYVYYEKTKAVYYLGMASATFEKTGIIEKKMYHETGYVPLISVWNFDGRKAAMLALDSKSDVKENMKKSSSYYEDLVETKEYDWKYTSDSSYLREKKSENTWMISYLPGYGTIYERGKGETVIFSSDRNKMYKLVQDNFTGSCKIIECKRVDKSDFKVGRSRTPSGTLHE